MVVNLQQFSVNCKTSGTVKNVQSETRLHTSLSECGGNITNLENGVITSPNFPEKYSDSGSSTGNKQCNWFINAKPKHRILLFFQDFEVEGKPQGEIKSRQKILND